MKRSSQPLWAVWLALVLHLGVLESWRRLATSTHSMTNLSSASKPISIQLKPQAPKPRKQLVQVSPPDEEKKPRKANYESEYHRQVDRETQGQNTSNEISSPAKSLRAPQRPQHKQGLLPKSFLPTWRDLEAKDQAARSDFNDSLPNLNIGAETRLNTFEWKHASYFNRIKESVSRHWNPNRSIQRYDPAAALIGQQDRLTVLSVTIDPKGELTSIEVFTSSGVFYLDDEAQNAFRKAAPFPHPPQALFSHEPVFRFDFGFMVSMKRGFMLDFD
ncbi:MAG: TonB family protein [Myxococcaceae bacterium]|nr:TonB family protein [Myxococcaceae bacterium]MBH2006513.1 TonB family protein [Myxococcaceae bacterium]